MKKQILSIFLVTLVCQLTFAQNPSKGDSINVIQTSPELRLLKACKERNGTMVNELIKKGVSLKSSKESSHYLYEILIKQMQSEKVMENFSVKYVYNRKPEDLEVFKLLIESGASTSYYGIMGKENKPSETDLGGGLVLHSGNTSIPYKIVDNTSESLNALEFAQKNELSDYIALLYKSPILLKEIQNKNYIAAYKLVESGEDVNIIDGEGKSAIIYAVENENVELTKLIISKGGDVNLTDNSGMTPLLLASSKKSIEIVKVLLEAGANPDVADKNNFTPILAATSMKSKEIVKMLLDANVDPAKKYTFKGYTFTLLELAKELNATEIISLLNNYKK
ncbi:MAG: ankyrin repeat domain-containing protein [Bacteroidales bacterium]|nr:ankyrin repeat domain-containing protein [Bacteroidales bacterium]